MDKKYLIELKKHIASLTETEKKQRDLYLKMLAEGIIEGPLTGYPSIDKQWLKYYEDEYILGNIPNKRVYDVIYENNKNHLNDIALLYYGRKITYEEFFHNIELTARSFSALNVSEGDIVSVIMPSIPETLYSFYALNRLGVTANMIDPRYNSEKMKKLINETNSKVVLVINIAEDKISEIKDDIKAKYVISVSPAESLPFGLKFVLNTKNFITKFLSDKKVKYLSWKEFIYNGQNSPFIDSKYNPEFPCAIVYTGGTTGVPKGAIMTTYGLNTIVYHQKSAMPLVKRQSRYLDIMPPFIAFGLTCGMNNPLSEGAILDLIPTFDHNKFAELIVKHKPNHVIGVPSFWISLTTSKYAKDKSFSYLSSPIAGGDGISMVNEKSVNAFLLSHGCISRLAKGYGLTEVSSCASFTCSEESNKLGSVGIPLVKDNFKVVDPISKEELRTNETGEILINTSSIMGGYLNNKEATNNIIETDEFGTNWVKTEDVGYIDSDGCLFINDRIKNVIIRPDGFKVFPIEIERWILEHPLVQNCKVVGVSQNEFASGKFPLAYIVLKPYASNNTEEVLSQIWELCFKHLPEYQIPIDFIVKSKLPLTSIGKIDVKLLQSEYEERKKYLNRALKL